MYFSLDMYCFSVVFAQQLHCNGPVIDRDMISGLTGTGTGTKNPELTGTGTGTGIINQHLTGTGTGTGMKNVT